jgi:hypothetical protein
VTKDSDRSAGTLETEKTGFFAEENQFDRRTLWRVGTWGAAAVGAVVVAVMANQTSLGWRRNQIAAADLSRQAQQLQSTARDSQNETRRLAAAIDTLNNDRDRLFSRVTVLEQGFDSVTGTIGRPTPPATAPGSSSAAQKSSAIVPTAPSEFTELQPATAPQATLPAIGPLGATSAAAPPATDKPRTDLARLDVKPDIKPVKPESRLEPKPDVKPDLKAEIKSSAEVKPAEAKPPEGKIAEAKSSEAKPSDVKSAVRLDAKSEAKADPKPDIIPDSRSDQLLAVPSFAVQMAASTAAPGAGEPVSTTMPAPGLMIGPPDPAAPRLEAAKPADAGPQLAPVANAMASVPTKDNVAPDAVSAKPAIQRTEFAVDLGTANSVNGLRALWRSVRSNANLAELYPIIMIKEGNTGLGMQLRLAAGPLRDAAAAAKICAALAAGERTCETTVYDGQRLAMSAEEAQPPGVKPLPATSKPYQSRRYPPRHAAVTPKREEPPPPAPPQQPPKPEPSSISTLFRR